MEKDQMNARAVEAEVMEETVVMEEATVEDTNMFNSEYITEDLTIHEVKAEYNIFMNNSKAQSDEIADVINVEEMQDIADLIKQFNERLEGVVEVQPQNTVEKATGKTIERLAMIPFLGKLLEGEAKEAKEKEAASKTARQILQEMFDVFTEKANVLEQSYEKAFKLRGILIGKEKDLEKFSVQVKYLALHADGLDKIAAIKLGGLVESNKLKNKEKIYNKLDFILQFIEDQLTTISLMMPGIETGLVEDSEISTFLTSVSEMNKIFKSLTDLSNAVGKTSSEKVMNLITEVNDSMTTTVDVQHLELLAKKNQEFMKKMITGTEKRIKTDAQTYGKLMDIGAGLDKNVLAYNESSKKVLLEAKSYMGNLENTIEANIVEEKVAE